MSETYNHLLALVKARHTCRGFPAIRWELSGLCLVVRTALTSANGPVLHAETVIV